MNRLDDVILRLQTEIHFHLRNAVSGVSEYELMRHLQSAGLFDFLYQDQDQPTVSEQLRLFQKHFLIMHCLYALRGQAPTQWEISPLNITYRPGSGADDRSDSREVTDSSDAFLDDYYSDLDHFYRANDASVDSLLRDFWARFDASQGDEGQALSALGLTDDCSWADIKSAYRRKAQQHHPDRGGDAREFAKLRSAFEQLKLSRSSRRGSL